MKNGLSPMARIRGPGTLQHDLGHRGLRLCPMPTSRQHCPDLAEHQGDTHIALVVPKPRAPTPALAPTSKLRMLKVPAMAEAVTRPPPATMPPPAMMAAGSTPGQSLAQPAKVPVMSMQ